MILHIETTNPTEKALLQVVQARRASDQQGAMDGARALADHVAQLVGASVRVREYNDVSGAVHLDIIIERTQ